MDLNLSLGLGNEPKIPKKIKKEFIENNKSIKYQLLLDFENSDFYLNEEAYKYLDFTGRNDFISLVVQNINNINFENSDNKIFENSEEFLVLYNSTDAVITQDKKKRIYANHKFSLKNLFDVIIDVQEKSFDKLSNVIELEATVVRKVTHKNLEIKILVLK